MENQESGNLVKLLIESFSDERFNQKIGEFEVVFNPNQYTLKYGIEYDQRQASGTTGNAPSFANMKSQDLALEFMIDGTGVASDQAIDVQAKVDDFLDHCYTYDGEIHRNRYLRVNWASLVFDCVLKSADVKYTLFDPAGKPLRAKIAAKFLGFINDELRVQKADAASPDRRHVRTIGPRGRIDLMTHLIYRTPEYYIDIARANKLTGFRKLSVGEQLVFPPVVRGGEQP